MPNASVSTHSIPAEQTLSEEHKTKGQNVAIRSNIGMAFILQAVTGPLMLLYCNDTLKLSATEIGIISALVPMSSLIKLPFIKTLDQFSKLKVLRVGYLFRLVAVLIIIALPSSQQTFAVFIAIVLFYQSSTELGPGIMWQPLMRDITDRNNRGQFFSKMRFVFTLFATLATAAIPFLVGSDLQEWEYKSILVFVALLMVNQILWSRNIPELIHKTEPESKKISLMSEFRKDIAQSQLLRWPLLITVLIQCQGVPIFAIFAKKTLEMPTNFISAYIFLMSSGALLSMLYWGKQNDVIGHTQLIKRIMVITLIFSPMVFFLKSVQEPMAAENYYLILAMYLSFGFMKGLVMAGGGITSTSILHFYTPSKQSVTLMAVFLTIVSISFALANLVSGWILEFSLSEHNFSVLGRPIDPFKLWLFVCYIINPIVVFFMLDKLKSARSYG